MYIGYTHTMNAADAQTGDDGASRTATASAAASTDATCVCVCDHVRDRVRTRMSTLADMCAVYDDEGYAVMTQDTARNAAFRAAIAAAVAAGCTAWLELGPGADAVLTRMVLAASPATRIVAVEGNRRSAAAAERALAAVGCGRAKIVHALSTDFDVAGDEDIATTIHAVLHEVLGYFASCEGVVFAARDWLRRRSPLRCAAWLPSTFGTFYAPALLDEAALAKRGALAVDQPHGRWVLTRVRVGSRALQCPWQSAAGCLEWLDVATQDWEAGGAVLHQCRRVEFAAVHAVTTGGCPATVRVNALLFYIWAGFPTLRSSHAGCADASTRRAGRGPTTRAGASGASPPLVPDADVAAVPSAAFVTALTSLCPPHDARVHAATAWPNVLLVLPTTWTLAAGDTLRVTTQAALEGPRPDYRVALEHVHGADGRVTARHEAAFLSDDSASVHTIPI